MKVRIAIVAAVVFALGGAATVPVARAGKPKVRAAITKVRTIETPACGRAGARVVSFRVTVERGLGRKAPTARAFADDVLSVLCDPRGWTRGGAVAFRLDPRAPLRIALRSAESTRSECLRLTGLDTMLRWSCAARYRGEVVLNADRWLGGSPWWGGPVPRYRELLANHEIGHILGFGHAACSGAGLRAPVMMQQSKGTAGCLRNPWPLGWEAARL